MRKGEYLMALIIDIAIILIIAFVIWRSAVRGFVRTVIEMVGYILAAVISISLSGTIAEAAYDNLLRPKVISAAQKTVDSTAQSAENYANEIWDSMPSFISKTVDIFGKKEEVVKDIGESVKGNGISAVENIADSAVRPIAINLIRTLSSVIIFLILLALVKFLARWINRLFSIPVVGSFNALLGGAVGAVKGFILIFITVFVIRVAVNAMLGSFWIFDQQLINDTFLFRFVYNLAAIG